MTFSRCTDEPLLRSILCHPQIYRHMHDDTAPPAEPRDVTTHSLLSYMAVEDAGEVIGVFIVAAHSAIMLEIHEAFMPCAWGARARRAAREFREWIWRETKCQRLIGS